MSQFQNWAIFSIFIRIHINLFNKYSSNTLLVKRYYLKINESVLPTV